MIQWKKIITTLTLSQGMFFGLFAHAVDENKSDTPDETPIDMHLLSEAFGNFIGRNIQSAGLEFNVDKLVEGIRNGVNEKPSPLTEEQYEKMMAKVQQQAFEKSAKENLTNAELFLKNNQKKLGIVVLEDDKLQYEVLNTGSGATVKANNSPLINYTGKLLDGTLFGSSEENGGAITLPLEHTIEGFKKGITGMQEGEKRRLFIHPDLGYGTVAGHLPPNSLLIFDIEIVEADHQDEIDNNDEQSDDDDDDDDADSDPSQDDNDNF